MDCKHRTRTRKTFSVFFLMPPTQESILKLPGHRPGASRKGSFLSYCAPCPTYPALVGRGTSRSSPFLIQPVRIVNGDFRVADFRVYSLQPPASGSEEGCAFFLHDRGGDLKRFHRPNLFKVWLHRFQGETGVSRSRTLSSRLPSAWAL